MDETARESTLEKMATLAARGPGLSEDHRRGVQFDLRRGGRGAGGLGAALKRYGLKPRARIHHLSVRADDPIWHLTAPIPATAHALKKAGMKLEDIDLVEINEAFASVVMAWLKETGYPHERTNVNGGAIALGHPLGASGAPLLHGADAS
jgi:acetyl-CoA C-acetyltransferase